jgi:hypothetical protein
MVANIAQTLGSLRDAAVQVIHHFVLCGGAECGDAQSEQGNEFEYVFHVHNFQDWEQEAIVAQGLSFIKTHHHPR